MLILVLLLYLKNRIISSASGKALCFLSCYSLSPPSLRAPTLLTHSQHQVPVLNSPVYCLVVGRNQENGGGQGGRLKSQALAVFIQCFR